MNAPLQEYVELAPWTTFGVGGPARYFMEAASEDDVRHGLEFAQSNRLPVFVLGGGSNLLIADRGFPGLVLKVGIRGMAWDADGGRVRLRAGAGENWDGIVAACVAKDFAGVECLSGIPGLAGGTPIQNVGAYGQEISGVLGAVRVLDRQTESLRDLSPAECNFQYRSSVFNTTQKNRFVVLEVAYDLLPGGLPHVEYPDLVRRFAASDRPGTLAEVRRIVMETRASKGMLIVDGDPDCRSAGSFFKNPIVTEEKYLSLASGGEHAPRYPLPGAAEGMIKTSAAWLIERSGFHRGYSKGRAAISGKHSLALTNSGGATAADVLRLAEEIQRGVEDQFGIRLLPEPVLVGFDHLREA